MKITFCRIKISALFCQGAVEKAWIFEGQMMDGILKCTYFTSEEIERDALVKVIL